MNDAQRAAMEEVRAVIEKNKEALFASVWDEEDYEEPPDPRPNLMLNGFVILAHLTDIDAEFDRDDEYYNYVRSPGLPAAICRGLVSACYYRGVWT